SPYSCHDSLFFFFYRSPTPPHLHSFPTRRSSDLPPSASRPPSTTQSRRGPRPTGTLRWRCWGSSTRPRNPLLLGRPPATGNHQRSEEHTSELLSRSDLVCRLLLEKKKKKKNKHIR